MARSVVELFDEAAALNESERAALAGLLLESIEGAPDRDVERAWRDELERRVAKLDAGEAELVPWEEVKTRLFSR